MKGLRTPLILVVVLTALGGVAYWDELATKKDDDAKKTKNKVFTADWEPTWIRYQNRSDGKSIDVTLEKPAGGTWLITAPIAVKADPYEVAKLWESVRDYQYEKEFSADKPRWKEFGLEAPKVSVELKNGDKTFALHMGEKAPVGYSVYTRSSTSDKVMLGSQFIVMPLSKTLFDLRQKSLADIAAETLSGLTYDDAKTRIVLTKKDGAWVMTEPVASKADADAILDFVGMLTRENATEFVDLPSAELKQAITSLTPPMRLVTRVGWQDTAGVQHLLAIVENGESLLAYENIETRLMKLGKDSRGKFLKGADDFRDHRVVDILVADVAKVKVDGKEAPSTGLLPMLESLKAVGFKAMDARTQPADHHIELTFKAEGRAPMLIEVWKASAEGETVVVKVSGKSELFLVSPSFIALLKQDNKGT